jgi:hypothetical protein
MPGQPELPALPPPPDDRHDEVREQEGPTINGNPLTPPDQTEPETVTVDAETGEVIEQGTEREPGADEGEDAKPEDKTTAAAMPITDALRKKLFAVAREKSVKEDWIKATIKERFGKDSTKDLTVAEADELLKAIRDEGPF